MAGPSDSSPTYDSNLVCSHPRSIRIPNGGFRKIYWKNPKYGSAINQAAYGNRHNVGVELRNEWITNVPENSNHNLQVGNLYIAVPSYQEYPELQHEGRLNLKPVLLKIVTMYYLHANMRRHISIE